MHTFNYESFESESFKDLNNINFKPSSTITELQAKQRLNADRYLIMGCGESASAWLHYLCQQTTTTAQQIWVFDTRPEKITQLKSNFNTQYTHKNQVLNFKVIDEDTLITELKAIEAELSKQNTDNCTDEAVQKKSVCHCFISPGLSPKHFTFKALHAFYERIVNLKHTHCFFDGELNLFAALLKLAELKHNYQPKLIGITGTNGKTTTTQLTCHLLKQIGLDALVAGNISPSLIAQWLGRYGNYLQDAQELPKVWVLELSSFQLALNDYLCLHSACILNLSEDHLDWHSTMQDYLEAKLRIASTQTHLVLYAQDPYLKILNQHSSMQTLKSTQQLHWFADASIEDTTKQITIDWQIMQPEQQLQAWLSYKDKVLMPMNALKIRGKHNALNALAALALCTVIDVRNDETQNKQANHLNHLTENLAALVANLRSYQGEKHRVQWIAQQESLSIYDDSKGTNIGATLAAIEGLTENNKRMALILGGDAKGQQLHTLMPALQKHVGKVYLLGKCKRDLADLCTAHGIDFSITKDDSLESFKQLCMQAYEESKQAQLSTLLLSPACASLDMFDNYAHRADLFVETIEACMQAL